MKKYIVTTVIILLFACLSVIYASETIIRDMNKTGKTSPIIVQYATPGFPMKAVADRVEGFVTIKFIVTKDGDVANIEVVESVPVGYFENSALNALEKYKFDPAIENGAAVDYTLELPFFFKFPDTSFSDDLDSRMQACRYADVGRRLIANDDNEKAVTEVSKAIELEPKFGTAYYYRSLAYMNMEDNEKALSDIDKAIELAPGVFGYLNHRGTVYLLKKDYQKAIEDFTKSLSIEPLNIVAYINRGDAFRLSEKYDEAVTDYTSALGLNEKLIHVHNNRGYTYYKMQNNFQACKDFNTACELGDCRALNHLKNQGACQE